MTTNCPKCDIEFDEQGKWGIKKFCSRSCANSRVWPKSEMFACIHCKKESIVKKNQRNIYCSNKCQGQYQWVNETVPKIERGELTHNQVKSLKKYLKETREEKCSECSLGPEWNKKPLTLQLDHIDGDSDNNFPDNLRLLCPNCHTQTETFGSKGLGSRNKKFSNRNKYLQKYRNIKD